MEEPAFIVSFWKRKRTADLAILQDGET